MPEQQGSVVSEPAFRRRSIRDWPIEDRPREKVLRFGVHHVSDAELLAILLRTGCKGATAVDLARGLFKDDRTLQEIATMDPEALQTLGIGQSRSVALAAAFELGRRVESGKEEGVFIHGPEDVEKIFGPKLRDRSQEEFWMLPLNSANRLLRPVQVTIGTLNASLVHPRECFRPAIERSAASVVFLHNHPSGNPEPSQEDIAITRQLADAGKLLGIPVHDHVIMARNSYTSMAERGILP
jgi:DNA repair protein RadC